MKFHFRRWTPPVSAIPASNSFAARLNLQPSILRAGVAALAATLLLMLPADGAPTAAVTHRFRVSDPQTAQRLLEDGGRLIEDYGAFKIIESSAASAASLAAARAQQVDGFDSIQLSGRKLNTTAPEVRSLRKPLGTFSGRRLHLIQFAGPIKPAWRQALEQTGAVVLNYLPQNAFLVYGDASALARLQSWAGAEPGVQWEGPYLGDYKVQPRLSSAAAVAAATTATAAAAETGVFAIQLAADDSGANAATLGLIDQWKLGPVRSDYQILNYRDLVVSLPVARLQEIAAQPDVISIQPHFEPRLKDERQDQILAGNLAGDLPDGPGYLAWLASKGFTQSQFDGSRFVVDVSDSGIDNGTTSPGHFGLYRLGAESEGSRVSYVRLVGSKNPGSTLQGCDGHGTLNAHIIAGYDPFGSYPFADPEGYAYGLGVCPFVKVGSSVIFDNSDPNDSFTAPNYSSLLTQAYNSGARISNNSWGSPGGGAPYDQDAQTYDFLVRDVGGSGANRSMVVVFVAGNDTNSSTINSPGTAKNVLTVGAAENVRSLSISEGGFDPAGDSGCPGDSDSTADSANDVVYFSSRGPCADGRMKPDLMAPGTHITGGVAQNSPPTTNGVGSALACFDGSGVCGLPGVSFADFFFPLGQQFYTVSTGTSHAAPAVSGVCALLRQFFINDYLLPPSPAMTKAYLINSTRYMTGANANDTLWSPNQGMGELDLGSAFDGAPRILRDQVGTDKFTGTGQTRTFSGNIVDPAKPFRVTLAWTDAPGSPASSGPALVNDLDLSVTVGSTTYKGNMFNGAYSVQGGAADSLNNVESVFLPAGSTDSFSVTVTAANIAANAINPGSSAPQQDFALVIYNSSFGSAPPLAPAPGSYTGLFYPSNDVQVLSSGFVTIHMTSLGSYTGNLQMTSARYSFTGRFDSAGAATNIIQRRGGAAALTLILQVDTRDNATITGSVSDGSTWLSSLQTYRANFDARRAPAPFAGKFTVVLPGSGNVTDVTRPPLAGYGTAVVSPAGRVTLSAALADGTTLHQTATVSSLGRWPFYAPLYRGRGLILGWLVFLDSQNLGGQFNWIRPPIPNPRYYTNGFALAATATGAAYQPPQRAGVPVLSFTSGIAAFSGGNLAAPITNRIVLELNNRVFNTSANRLTLSLDKARGLFYGTVVDPATLKPIHFKGAVLQNQDQGLGYFLGTNQAGSVYFGPAP